MTKRLFLCALAVFAACLLSINPAAKAATSMDDELRTGNVATASADIQQWFGVYLGNRYGTLDWNAINGTPGSTANTARMNELHAIAPQAMIEGTAFDLVYYLSAHSVIKVGATSNQAACVVGALVGSFASYYTVSPAQDEINTVQALVYAQFNGNSQQDPHHQSAAAVAQGRQVLLNSSNLWPFGVDGFQTGFTKGLHACGVPLAI